MDTAGTDVATPKLLLALDRSNASSSSSIQTATLPPHAIAGEAQTDSSPAEKLIGEGTRVQIELLLVNGRRARWEFGAQATIKEVREGVWSTWPEEFKGADNVVPTGPDALRILYLGRFLSDDSTLSSYGIVPGHTTILHLTIRTLTKASPDDDAILNKRSSNSCGCCIVS